MKIKHLIPLAALAVLLPGANLHAQIFETDPGSDTIGEFNDNGTPVGTGTLVSFGLDEPYGIALSGSDIYVANAGSNTIGEYTFAGTPVGSGTLVTGLDSPVGIAISGGDIFVTNASNNTIMEYTLAGTPVGSGTLVSGLGLNDPHGIAVSGSDIYVANFGGNTVTQYLTTGAQLGSGTLVSTGLSNPTGITVSGTDVLVTNYVNSVNNIVGEYNKAGTQLEAGSIGLYNPADITTFGSNYLVVNSSGFLIDTYSTAGTPHITGTLISSTNAIWGVAVGGAVAPGTLTPTNQTTNVPIGTNYAASITPFQSTGGYGSTATIAGGTASTTSNVTVAFNGAGNFGNIASDVVSVGGMPNKGTGSLGQTITDTFVLEISFDPNAANALGGPGALILLWRNPSTGQWVNAVDGNTGGTPDYVGDTAYVPSQYFVLGDYGVDTADGYAWAVVNHNSDFSVGNLGNPPEVVPEPSTWAMLAMGAVGLIFIRRRRVKA